MKISNPNTERVNKIINKLQGLGIAQLIAQNGHLDGRLINIEGQEVVNFGSCSYLGLDQHPNLKEASISAIERYGTQFSCSRAYVSIKPYEELEMLLEQIFQHPVIAMPTTSLGHISAIPIVVGSKDAVILDHQVHTSVHNAVKIAQNKGAHVEFVRHNHLEQLREKIEKLSQSHQKVWYMADGVYSMYGDYAPVQSLYNMLEEYEQLHLYIDDAHGMSWTGSRGCGYTLSQIPLHEKMLVATSLNKSFAAGGGVLICPNTQIKQLIRNCGSTLIFSGPIQPPMLGAAIASAKLHLSEETAFLQQELHFRMQYFVQLAKEYGLPLVNESLTPIFFIGIGERETGLKLCKQMMAQGYYTNIAIYPSVPLKNTGLRITLTLHQSLQDIENMLSTLAELLHDALRESQYSKSNIYKAFKIPMPAAS